MEDVLPQLKAKRYQRKVGISGIYGFCCHMHLWCLALCTLFSALSTTVHSQVAEDNHYFGLLLEFDLSQYCSGTSERILGEYLVYGCNEIFVTVPSIQELNVMLTTTMDRISRRSQRIHRHCRKGHEMVPNSL